MPNVCLMLDPPCLDWGFSVALAVCELSALFSLFHHSLLIDSFFSCNNTLHTLGTSMSTELMLCFTTAESREKNWPVKLI